MRPCHQILIDQSILGQICHICPYSTWVGYRYSSFGERSSPCTDDCSIGRYSEAGSPSCTLCPPGKYNPEVRQPSCIACVPGQFSAQLGAASVCTACFAGRFSNSTGVTSCEKCKGGFYQPSAGQVSCISCVAGKASNADATDCIQCESGTFVLSNTCQDCPAGRYAPTAAENEW